MTPDEEPPPLKIKRMTAYVPISEEMAMEYGLIPDTRPPLPPPTRWTLARRRVNSTIRQVRLTLGARIAGVERDHLEDISWL